MTAPSGELQNLWMFLQTIFYVALFTGLPIMVLVIAVGEWLAARAREGRMK